MRPYTAPNPPPIKQQSYRFAKGTTRVLKEEVVQTFLSEGKKADVVSEQVVTDAMMLD